MKAGAFVPSARRCSQFRAAVVAWLGCLLATWAPEFHAQTLGDLDNDGLRTVRDLTRIVSHINGLAALAENEQVIADLDQNGAVNEADTTLLIQEVLGTREPELLPLSSVRFTSPDAGAAGVAVTRETVIHFTIPLAPATTLTTQQLRATFGGNSLLTRVELSGDRKKATLFYLEPLPSNARIEVSLDGTGLTDLLGRAFDGDGDGVAGGTFRTHFETLSITPVTSTAIVGRVFASEPGAGQQGAPTDVPLAGVTITVDGAEQTLRAVTDAQGNFTLDPCPAGTFFVQIDGRTSPQSDYPNGDYYPVVGKEWFAIAGRNDNLAGETGEIFLPCICQGTLQTTSPTVPTLIEFPPDVVTQFPELAGTEINVPANSLFANDGTRGGRVGIAPVAPQRLPSPLPPGLDLPLVITVQTDGGTNFDQPVPLCLPNLPDPDTGVPLPPGAQSALWSFNHDLGDWEVVGPMRVTADGLFVKTDPGVGIRQPGWHGSRPGSQASGNTRGTQCGRGTPADQAKMADLVRAGEAMANTAVDFTAATADVLGFVADRAGAATGVLPFFQGVGIIKSSYQCLDWESPRELSDRILSCAGAGVDIASVVVSFAIAANPASVALATASTALFVASTALDAAGLYNDLQSIDTALNGSGGADGIRQKLENCVESRTHVAPAKRQQTRQRVVQAADRVTAAAMQAQTEIQIQVPIYQEAQQFRQEASPEAMQVLSQSSAGNPTAGLNESEWRHWTGRARDMATRLETLSRRPPLPRVLDNFVRNFNDYNRDIGPALYPPPTTIVVTGLPVPPSPPPPPGPSFCLLESTGFEQRFKSHPSGRISVIVSPGRVYRLYAYEPANNRIAFSMVYGAPNGRLERIPDLPMRDCLPQARIFGALTIAADPDTDGDGLIDRAERIVGTLINNPDSDGDGVNDFAEVQQGSDPTQGLLVQQGLIANVPTTGSCEDICAVNNLAVTANGVSGVSVYNIFSGLNPSRIAQVDTPGSAVAVACSGNLVAVADYSAGLVIIDLSDPENIGIARQVLLSSPAIAVAVSGPTAYVGTSNGRVIAVDMPTGSVLESLFLSSSPLQDLFVYQETLYALQSGSLHALPLDAGVLAVADTEGAPGGTGAGGRRLRLFGGNGTVYSTWRQGFNIFDVATDPNAPLHLQNVSTGQQGWKQIVANGSGLGLAAVGINSTNDGPHHLDIYDLGADGRGSAFLTTLNTPGLAAAVSVYNGLAYIADSWSGLSVINYRAFDTAGNPPTAQFESNFDLVAAQIEEGKLLRLTAVVTDDIQVKNVRFFVDGNQVLLDGNFPFVLRTIVPSLAEATEIDVEAVAEDTGGNTGTTGVLTLTITPDAVAPDVIAFSPVNNSLHVSLDSLRVVFSESILESTLTSGITVTEEGPDDIHGTADDVQIGGNVSYREDSFSAFFTPAEPLDGGGYRIHVATTVTDIAGNALTAAAESDFRIASDTDTDGDGLPDDWEILLGYNPTVTDSDGNGTDDGDEDFDNDGIKNRFEILVTGTDPRIADSDGDGVNDGDEDGDADGLTNAQELNLGTNLALVDSDGDGFDDFTEVQEGTDPLDNASGASNRIQSLALGYINALPGNALPVALSTAVRSNAVTFINPQGSTLPATLSTAVRSPAASFYNPQGSTLPPTLPTAVSADGVSYQNHGSPP